MATISLTSTIAPGGVNLFTSASALTNTGSDVTTAIYAPDFPEKEVQVFGTFGAAGNLAIEASLDGGTTYAVVNDVDGTPLNITAASVVRVRETLGRLRARVTAGDGTTSLTVIFAMRSGGAYGA